MECDTSLVPVLPGVSVAQIWDALSSREKILGYRVERFTTDAQGRLKHIVLVGETHKILMGIDAHGKQYMERDHL